LAAARCLLIPTNMKFICRHCEQLFDGEAYRVSSVENDMVMLDMIVCHGCALVARDLELPTQKIDSPASN
jgi:RNase P subunit RPR2